MCLTSVEFYPYMTNLETNVTRVAPAMAEFFGLDSEFIQYSPEVCWNGCIRTIWEGYYQDLEEEAMLKGN